MLFAFMLLVQAQSFSGTYTIAGQVPITLTLRQAAGGRISGSLIGRTSFQVQAQAQGGQFSGFASNQSGRMYLAGQLDQSGNLGLVLAEVGPDGQPRQETARQAMAIRTGGAGNRTGRGAGGAAGGKGPGGAPGAQRGGRSGAVAATGVDRQLAQLLTRSAWCAFSYNQNSGTSSTDRVVFRPDGTGSRNAGGETYNSGPNGAVSGQSSSGGAFQWRLANGVLIVGDGSGQETPVPLAVSQNSNGYPIITASGKEYSMCN